MIRFVKSASKARMQEMEEWVDSLNELSHEHLDTHGYMCEYVLERCGDAWGVVSYVAASWFPWYRVGDREYAVSFVYCTKCKHVWVSAEDEYCYRCEGPSGS